MNRPLHYVFCVIVNSWILLSGQSVISAFAQELPAGEAIWQKLCVRCHGQNGEGVQGEFERPLRSPKSLEELASLIDQTMPEDDPKLCIDGDAKAVAKYVLEKFIGHPSPASLPRIELMHLTTTQYLNAVADLFQPIFGKPETPSERGLSGKYFNSKVLEADKIVETRLDAQIDFDWKQAGPLGDKTSAQEFCVSWEGSIFASETGTYRFSIQSPNGYRLYINRMDEPLLDNWVATIDEPEKSAEIRLLGGRWYSMKLQSLKVKDPGFSIRFLWEQPHRLKTVVPQQALGPTFSRPVFVVQTPFPADDSSVGYQRGTLVSAEWDNATTDAAIEIATVVTQRIKAFVHEKPGNDQFELRSRKFCEDMASRAFRRKLSPDETERYVNQFFQSDVKPLDAVKGSMISIFKSPWFLYMGLSSDDPATRIADQISWIIFDSMASGEVREFFQSPAQADLVKRREFVEKMLESSEAKVKWREFFVNWLRLDRASEVSKDPESFAGFDELLVDDLQESALRFVDEIFWSEASDYRQFFLADYLLLNKRLKSYYSPESSDDPSRSDYDFQRVVFDKTERAGLLTHPLLLSQLAYYRTTSPIHRGVFISRNLMGIGLKPPPVAVEPLGEDFDANMTTRQRVEFQTRAENCMSCHRVINPLGFALESFDAVGRRRTMEKDRPVDSTVLFEDATGKELKLTGSRELAEFLVSQRKTHRHFVESVFHHAVKQPVAAFGAKLLDELTDYFIANEYNMKKLIIEIALRASASSETFHQGNAPQGN